MYRNHEHYADQTAGRAMAHIEIEQDEDACRRIKALMRVIKPAAEMAGLEIVGRIAFRDTSTGREYR